MADTTATTHDEKIARTSEADLERGTPDSPQVPSETATLKEAPEAAKTVVEEEHVHSRDFGFIPIPKHLRVSKENPPHFDIFLNILFGIGSTFSEWRLLLDRGMGESLPSPRPMRHLR